MGVVRRSRSAIPKTHITLSVSRECSNKIVELKLRGINVSEQFENLIMAFDGVSEYEVAAQELEAEILTSKAKLFELELLKRARDTEEAKKKEKQEQLRAEGKVKELDWSVKK